ncbi:unnamed protein product [Clavelina lepadiformis]|uniref:Uncharacterized protein n=1 Tax=Clavelina lepadiformis TaxID=159417 RepID=A0ABP0GX72_CLALP
MKTACVKVVQNNVGEMIRFLAAFPIGVTLLKRSRCCYHFERTRGRSINWFNYLEPSFNCRAMVVTLITNLWKLLDGCFVVIASVCAPSGNLFLPDVRIQLLGI